MVRSTTARVICLSLTSAGAGVEVQTRFTDWQRPLGLEHEKLNVTAG